jgi:hypothetical protein
LRDRKACLTSTESRWASNVPGGEIHGVDCTWCSNGPCTSGSDERCQPKTWLQAKSITGIDTCLNAAGSGSIRSN